MTDPTVPPADVVANLIRLTCAHEAGHAVVAAALGCQVSAVDVFNVSGGRPGKASVCVFTTTGGPVVGAVVAAAGEVAEMAMYPHLAAFDFHHTLAGRRLNGLPPMPPGMFALPPKYTDAVTIARSARQLGHDDFAAFGREVAASAGQIVGEQLSRVRGLAAELLDKCDAARVADRCPAYGVDGDGPQWVARGAAGPLATVAAVLDELRRLAGTGGRGHN